MISWMQKRKKYLVITIWISTIAFVGAGFVGWGSYSFSSSNAIAASVGDTKISIEQLQFEYTRLYNIYNQLLNGNLDEAQAKQMGIDSQALNNLITKTLMLNYAHDLGLRVAKEAIIEEIIKIPEFQVDGTFSQERYKEVLQNNQLKPKDFEASLKESILLKELGALLSIPLTPLENQLLKIPYTIEDKLHIQILQSNSITFTPTQEEIKHYWEEHKDIYLTQRGYELQSVLIPLQSITPNQEELKKYYEDFKNQFLDEQGQVMAFDQAKVKQAYQNAQAQKEALKQYLNLRKDNSTLGEPMTLFENDLSYGNEIIFLLSQAKENDTIKPIKTDKGYLSVKITKIIPSQPKPYEDAKEDAKHDFIEYQTLELLKQKAQANLARFEGVDIGYVDKQTQSIQSLNKQETRDFINQLFAQKEAKGYVIINNKAVLYEILNQRIKNSDIINQNLDFLMQSGKQIKERLIEQEFLDYLSQMYKITKNI